MRACLGLCVVYSFHNFSQQISRQFGKDVAKYLVFITVTQFHFLFYITRPLPNVFALAVGKSMIEQIFYLFKILHYTSNKGLFRKSCGAVGTSKTGFATSKTFLTPENVWNYLPPLWNLFNPSCWHPHLHPIFLNGFWEIPWRCLGNTFWGQGFHLCNPFHQLPSETTRCYAFPVKIVRNVWFLN